MMGFYTDRILPRLIDLSMCNKELRPFRERVVGAAEGRVLVALALPGTDPVQKVSIIPRGIAALGYTMQRPTQDRFLMSRSELANRMAVLLGGRAAERLVFGEVSTGAADDLARATDIARNMMVRFGMTAELCHVAYEPETGTFLAGQTPTWRPRSYADGTAEAIDHAINALVDEAFRTASGRIATRRPARAGCGGVAAFGREGVMAGTTRSWPLSSILLIRARLPCSAPSLGPS
ncbi:MAG: hypothetical protein HC868_13115 [Sphingomonadales bacterium]|nr:hypothetical protein [Sphingomonadales bacterium]